MSTEDPIEWQDAEEAMLDGLHANRDKVLLTSLLGVLCLGAFASLAPFSQMLSTWDVVCAIIQASALALCAFSALKFSSRNMYRATLAAMICSCIVFTLWFVNQLHLYSNPATPAAYVPYVLMFLPALVAIIHSYLPSKTANQLTIGLMFINLAYVLGFAIFATYPRAHLAELLWLAGAFLVAGPGALTLMNQQTAIHGEMIRELSNRRLSLEQDNLRMEKNAQLDPVTNSPNERGIQQALLNYLDKHDAPLHLCRMHIRDFNHHRLRLGAEQTTQLLRHIAIEIRHALPPGMSWGRLHDGQFLFWSQQDDEIFRSCVLLLELRLGAAEPVFGAKFDYDFVRSDLLGKRVDSEQAIENCLRESELQLRHNT